MYLHQNDLPADASFTDSVAVDTEAMGLAIKRDRLCLVQLCSAGGEVHLVQIHRDQQHKAENLKKILMDQSILKIFHYARFDVSLLNHTFQIKTSPVYCTKVASKLVRTYTDRHGLKNLCREVLGVDVSKQEQTSDWGRETLSPEQLKYAAGDVLHLHSLREKLNQMLDREGKMSLANECFAALEVFASLELAGMTPEELFQH
ncbi:MAG: ribonuclease H-like domain-containing protein [Holosporaceae bacterium]|jgi:ribonuclease D|nr:ribonuclease H-like domain-containing protein [Holosporaceae bacterium]